ncbi:MAG TPA: hypothetical protein VME70_09040 [Mycobacteriales bacterium]|nr:hypothetical protein [Mycobacteriales bacterium]
MAQQVDPAETKFLRGWKGVVGDFDYISPDGAGHHKAACLWLDAVMNGPDGSFDIGPDAAGEETPYLVLTAQMARNLGAWLTEAANSLP